VLQLHKDRLAGKLDENYDVEEAWNGHAEGEGDNTDVMQDLWNSGMLDSNSDSFSDSFSDSEEDPELAVVMQGLSANAPVLASSQPPSLTAANQKEEDEEDSDSASFSSDPSTDDSSDSSSFSSDNNSGAQQSEIPPLPTPAETPRSNQGSLPSPSSSSLASSPAPGAATSPEEDFLQVVEGPGASAKHQPPLVLQWP